MNKEIYFCVDAYSYEGRFPCVCFYARNYEHTQQLIDDGCDIVTTSIAHLSFDLINLGYDIYLCYKDKRVKIEPHMDLTGIGEPCKDLKFGHNIFRLFRAGVFNELLGIKKGE